MTNTVESRHNTRGYGQERADQMTGKIQVLAGVDILRKQKLLEMMATLMSTVYAQPPFSEAGRNSSGQRLSLEDIRNKFPQNEQLSDDVLISKLQLGHYSGIAPYYPIEETTRALSDKVTMPGTLPIVALSSKPNDESKLRAFAAAYMCRTAGSARGIETAAELMIRTPYGAQHRNSLRDFAGEIARNKSIYDPRYPALCLDEFVVDPNEQGKGLGRKVSFELTSRLLLEGTRWQPNPLDRQGLFITSLGEQSKMGKAVMSAVERGVPVELQRLERDGLTAVYSPNVTEIFMPELSQALRKLRISR